MKKPKNKIDYKSIFKNTIKKFKTPLILAGVIVSPIFLWATPLIFIFLVIYAGKIGA